MFDRPGVGQLSARLLRILEKLQAESRRTADRLVLALRDSIRDYASLPASGTIEDVRECCALNVRLWHNSLMTGRSATAAELYELKKFARQRARQGIPLASLLQALRTGSMVLWEEFLREAGDDPTIVNELLTKVSPYVLHHSDQVAHTMSEAYLEEQHSRLRWRSRLRQELCSLVFSDADDPEGFREHGMALGMEVSVPHVAIAFKTEDGLSARLSDDGDDQTSLDPIVQAVAGIAGLPAERILHTRRHGHLLLWLPAAGLEPFDIKQSAAEQLKALVEAHEQLRSIGVGLPDSGAPGWRLSADQAMRAIEVGLKLVPGRLFHCYADVAMEDLIQRNRNVARYFADYLNALASEPGLLETLKTYLLCRQQRKRAASKLDIHPNTLTYRLQRVETLLGVALDDAAAVTRLHLAFQTLQLI